MSFLLTLTPLLAATKKTTSSGSDEFLLIILVLFVGVYFLFLRPRQQQARRQRESTSNIEVGDEVLTVGGIVGVVVDVDGDRYTLRSGGPIESEFGGDSTYMVVVRQAIQRKTDPVAADGVGIDGHDNGHDHDHDHDEYGVHDDEDEDEYDDEDHEHDDGEIVSEAGTEHGAEHDDGVVGTNGTGPQPVDGGGSASSTEEGRGG